MSEAAVQIETPAPAIECKPDSKPEVKLPRLRREDLLTPEQARVVYTAIAGAATPNVGYKEWVTALATLYRIGGGYCCRKCTNLGIYPHHTGELVCEEHKEK